MNSKFTPIAKVRKQQMDKIETLLAKARFKKQEIEDQLISLNSDIQSMQTPKSGSISLMTLFTENLSILRRDKKSLGEKLLVKTNEVQQLQERYKMAHIEFEKIKYLEEQDFEEWIEKIKKQEQLDMDEISNMLFTNKG